MKKVLETTSALVSHVFVRAENSQSFWRLLQGFFVDLRKIDGEIFRVSDISSFLCFSFFWYEAQSYTFEYEISSPEQ